MLGLSRWTEKGGSYRTVQRFFYTIIPWAQVFWTFFREPLLETYLLAGDECVVTKAGKQTHGLDYFFSSLRQKAVPGLSFFTLSLVSIRQRRSYPICVEQTMRTEEEKAVSKARWVNFSVFGDGVSLITAAGEAHAINPQKDDSTLYHKQQCAVILILSGEDTFSFTARWQRKGSISAAPISLGLRLLWKRIKHSNQSTP